MAKKITLTKREVQYLDSMSEAIEAVELLMTAESYSCDCFAAWSQMPYEEGGAK